MRGGRQLIGGKSIKRYLPATDLNLVHTHTTYIPHTLSRNIQDKPNMCISSSGDQRRRRRRRPEGQLKQNSALRPIRPAGLTFSQRPYHRAAMYQKIYIAVTHAGGSDQGSRPPPLPPLSKASLPSFSSKNGF